MNVLNLRSCLLLTILGCSQAIPEPPAAQNAPAIEPEKTYAGQSLAEWRERIKNLDPQDPQSASAVPGLIEIAEDTALPWFSRSQAALTLGRIGPAAKAAVPRLIELVKNEIAVETNPANRSENTVWLMKSLALFGPESKSAAPVLKKILQDNHAIQIERLAAIDVLSQIGVAHREVLPALINLLQTQATGKTISVDQAAELRSAACSAITFIGPNASVTVPTLIRTTNDTHESVRRSAVSALGAMGGQSEIAIPALVDRLASDSSEAVRDAAGNALVKVGPAAIESLEFLLKEIDPSIRWRAAQALGKFGPLAQNSIPKLKPVLEDANPQVQLAAIIAYWNITQDQKTVVPYLINGLQNTDRQIRIQSFRLFSEIGPSKDIAEKPLRKLLDSDQAYVRQIAKLALDVINE